MEAKVLANTESARIDKIRVRVDEVEVWKDSIEVTVESSHYRITVERVYTIFEYELGVRVIDRFTEIDSNKSIKEKAQSVCKQVVEERNP